MCRVETKYGELCGHLDELIDITNGWDKVWNEGLEGSVQLQHLWLVLHDALEQILHLLTDRQIFIFIRVVAT